VKLASLHAALSAFRHRDFRRLWAGTFCGTAAQWVQQAALGWVVYDLTGSSTLLGAVIGARAIPMLLLAPVSGLVAERFDRRFALALCQLPMAVMSFLVGGALALDRVELWHLFAFTFVAGINTAFDRTLRNALVFDVVPRSEVSTAVALNTIAFSVTRALGPALAGLLIGWIGSSWNFVLQGLMYLGVVWAALSIAARPRPAVHAKGSAWPDMKEGLHFAATDPVARMMMILGLVPPILLIPSFSALMPVFAVDVFRTGPEGLGLLLSAVGAGGVAGGVLAAAISRYEHIGRVQVGALLVFAFSLIGFALSPNVPVALVCLLIAGAAEMVHASSNHTTLQMCAPEKLRGRVASLLPIFPAFIAVGSATSGLGADLFGAEAFVIATALLGAAVAAGAWLRSRSLRSLRLTGLVAGKR